MTPIHHKIKPAVGHIAERLTAHGFEAYVVGGAVRDLLLDIEPKDYDLATSASPEDVRHVFGRRQARIIGRRFRLVHVRVEGEIFEVSTFRREPTPEERQGRVTDDGVMLWRDNEFGSLEQDAYRRDFTVNALYYDPVGGREIIDLVGGVQDLQDGRVRMIGEPAQRLEEDPVRMLRALKLVGQNGFSLEAELAQQIREMASQIALASHARLFEELLKILAGSGSSGILGACREYGLLQHYWPGLAEAWGAGAQGKLMHDLLRERDRRVRGGNYSTSKALALATACLPSVAEALGTNGIDELWTYELGIETECRQAIRRFFHPFPVSRFLTARVRDIILLLPKLKDGTLRKRVLRHPEYKYGRELLSLLVAVQGWDDELLQVWPQPVKGRERHPRDTTGRRRGRRGRRKRQD